MHCQVLQDLKLIQNLSILFFLFIECSDANIQCPNAECIETNNPATPVYCQCYDGTRRDPRGNDTCPSG